MKELLNRVNELQAPANDMQVLHIVEELDKLDVKPSIKTLESVLKYYKQEQKRLLSEDILNWMMENEQTSFETDDCKVSIKTYVSSKILDPTLAFPWLNRNQYGDLIKDTLEFPKGELTEDLELILEEKGASYTKKSGIHPQTLKKVISDRLKDGEDLPDEDNGIKINYYDECVVKEK